MNERSLVLLLTLLAVLIGHIDGHDGFLLSIAIIFTLRV